MTTPPPPVPTVDPQRPSGGSERSPWVYVGCACGCGCLLVLLLVAAMFASIFRAVRDFSASVSDPVYRTEKVVEEIGTETLPNGYQVAGFFRVPFLLRVSMLTDDGTPDGEFGERNFFLVRLDRWMSRRITDDNFTEQLNDVTNNNVNVRFGAQLSNGTLDLDRFSVRYDAREADIEIQGEDRVGVATILSFDCGDVTKRYGLHTDARRDDLGERIEFDLGEMTAFLNSVDPCQAR